MQVENCGQIMSYVPFSLTFLQIFQLVSAVSYNMDCAVQNICILHSHKPESLCLTCPLHRD